MAQKLFFVCAGLFLLVFASRFAVSFASTSAQMPFVVTPDGNAFMTQDGTWYEWTGQWTQNAAPRVPGGDIVAFDGHSAMNSRGDWFEWAGQWVLNNNVFTSSGVPQAPGDPVVAMAGHRVFTASGEWFTWVGPNWVHSGNIFTGGPVLANPQSWGALKTARR